MGGMIDKNECVGLTPEISTEPAAGSPAECKCNRMTINGPFSPGPLVKCEDCLDVRRTTDPNSCPVGTKLFSPRSSQDWTTFFASEPAAPARAPHWIIDVTKPVDGCLDCYTVDAARAVTNTESQEENGVQQEKR